MARSSPPCRCLARVLLLAGILCGLSPGALADIVHLKSGRTVEGTTAPGKKPGTIEVRTGGGVVMTIPSSEILRIEKKQSPADQFDERLRGLALGDIEAARELLVFGIR